MWRSFPSTARRSSMSERSNASAPVLLAPLYPTTSTWGPFIPLHLSLVRCPPVGTVSPARSPGEAGTQDDVAATRRQPSIHLGMPDQLIHRPDHDPDRRPEREARTVSDHHAGCHAKPAGYGVVRPTSWTAPASRSTSLTCQLAMYRQTRDPPSNGLSPTSDIRRAAMLRSASHFPRSPEDHTSPPRGPNSRSR